MEQHDHNAEKPKEIGWLDSVSAKVVVREILIPTSCKKKTFKNVKRRI